MHTFACRVVTSLLACLAIGVTGCGARPTPSAPPPLPIEQASAPVPQPRVQETADVPKAAFDPAKVITAVRSVEPRATVGALVVDRSTGAELVAIEPDRPFRSASLVKLLIAMDALDRRVDDRTRKQIARMLSLSDDNIANSLWVAGGGPMIVKRSANRLGLTAIRTPKNPGRWGDVLITAHEIARIYEYLLTSLPEQDRTLIVDALARAQRSAADGFDQFFGIPEGLGGTWAIKQGWSDSPTDLVIHTSGLFGDGWRYIVVLLTEHPLPMAVGKATRSVTAGAKALSPLF